MVPQELRSRTGQDHHTSKNAMGGVGLLFGLANEQPLQSFLPKVSFIEFSTGDLNLGLTPLDQLPKLLTELLDRICEDGALAVLVHNWRADFEIDDRAGVRRIYNEIACEYGIPVIENHRWVQCEIAAGLRSETYFRDICHTTPEGSSVYAAHSIECLQDMARHPAYVALSGTNTRFHSLGTTRFHEVPSDLLLAIGAHLSSFVYAGTGQEFPVAEFSQKRALCVRASGTLKGVAFVSGPRSGWTELSVNGAVVKRFRCFDRNSYYRRYILLPFVCELSGALLEMRTSEELVDVEIAKKPHEDFKLARTMQFVHFAGTNLAFERAEMEVPVGSVQTAPLWRST
jgi:hypothetical protein